MRIIKNQYGRYFLECDEVNIKKDWKGKVTEVMALLGDLNDLIKLTPAPVLEDIMFLVSAELMERDRKEVEEDLNRLYKL